MTMSVAEKIASLRAAAPNAVLAHAVRRSDGAEAIAYWCDKEAKFVPFLWRGVTFTLAGNRHRTVEWEYVPPLLIDGETGFHLTDWSQAK